MVGICWLGGFFRILLVMGWNNFMDKIYKIFYGIWLILCIGLGVESWRVY